MSNLNLLAALVANLESAHRIASQLKDDAEDGKRKEVAEKLGDVLGKLFGGADQADPAEPEAETTDAKPTVSEEVVEGKPAAPVEAAAAVDQVAEKLKAVLNDPQYKLRAASTLIKESGFDGDEDDLLDYLDDNLVEVVTKTRRSDRATLIGLKSRN